MSVPASVHMDKSKTAKSPPMLPVIGAIFLGLVLMDLFKLWFPQNFANAVGAFIGTLSLGAAKTFRLSWRRAILGSLGIAAAVFTAGLIRDLLLAWL